MLAFLAIVADEDLKKGIAEPSYILCQQADNDDLKTGMVVVNVKNNPTNKLLVTSLVGHDDLVHFLSNYRTREWNNDERHGSKRRKYYPKGALFWFPCNEFGVIDKSQLPLFVKFVPDRSFNREGAKKLFEKEQKMKQHVVHKLTKEPAFMDAFQYPKLQFEREIEDGNKSECSRSKENRNSKDE